MVGVRGFFWESICEMGTRDIKSAVFDLVTEQTREKKVQAVGLPLKTALNFHIYTWMLWT